MLKTTTRADKAFAQMSDIALWQENPKTITRQAIDKVKNDIQELGVYKPLIVNSGVNWGVGGEILGGNARFMALQELKYSEAWVSLVSPKDEEQAIAYALSDNEQVGSYDIDRLSELLMPYRGGILDQFTVQLSTPVPLSSLLNSVAPPADYGTTPGASVDSVEHDERKKPDIESYMNAAVKQIIMYFPSEEYQTVIEQLQKIMELEDIESVTEVFKFLLKQYEENNA